MLSHSQSKLAVLRGGLGTRPVSAHSGSSQKKSAMAESVVAEAGARRSVTPTDDGARVSSSPSSAKRSGGRRTKQIPVTVPKPFKLSLQQRIAERHQFDSERRQKDHEMEEKERAEKEKKEKEELKEYRKKLVFKANPIQHYRDIHIAPSDKRLTVPSSPRLVSTTRSRQVRGTDQYGNEEVLRNHSSSPACSQPSLGGSSVRSEREEEEEEEEEASMQVRIQDRDDDHLEQIL